MTEADQNQSLAIIEEQRNTIERLVAIVEERDRQIEKLEKQIEELTRRGKRQAAPFSKGAPKKDPKPPGRKAGAAYGRQALRSRPRKIDQRVDVGCPLWCDTPGCHGPVRLAGKVSSYVVDLPPIKPVVTEFTNHYGFCEGCGCRVWRPGAGQVGDPFSPTKVHLGSGVVSLASYLKTAAGLSFGKISSLFEAMADLGISPSALCRSLQRVARRGQKLQDRLVEQIRESPVVYADETGWRIGGHSSWLWAFTNGQTAVYSILRGRGYAEAASVLGADFAGTLGVDGWAPYRKFAEADIQTCLAHLLRRCDEVLDLVTKGAVRFPRAVKAVLQSAIATRDRHRAGEVGDHGLLVAKGKLEARLDRLLESDLTNRHNRRFARHLRQYREAILPFMTRPELEATNWPAEQTIRPAVINRKTCAGNRTERGATTLAVLMSILRTCSLQKRDSVTVFRRLYLGIPVSLAAR